MMNNTQQEQIEKKLLSYAKQDMTIARKHGQMSIADTKQGLLDLSYNGTEKVYTLMAQGGKVLATGKAKVIAAALAGLYTVVIEGVSA
jgi:hypothetical protein